MGGCNVMDKIPEHINKLASDKNLYLIEMWKGLQESEGNFIYVSEYKAPSDFECIWEKQITNSLHQNKTYKPIEKLFTL